MEKSTIEISSVINAPLAKVWEYYTQPEHVTKWNHASQDWHSPSAANNLQVGGKFNYRMEAKDGSAGFDFMGMYTKVEPQKALSYDMDDQRHVDIVFEPEGDKTKVSVAFEAEDTNSLEMQRQGWQAILDNFANYTENN